MFDNFVSLGWNCGVASSMSKYGLRSWAGPFDWCTSDFAAVLKTIENDFTDFLVRENIMVDSNAKRIFKDTKYNFCMPHDVEEDLEKEYPSIKKKYFRRAERFQIETTKKTCFIRMIRNEEEIEFIRNHVEYIEQIIKKSNPQNEILYIYHNRWKKEINNLMAKIFDRGGEFWGLDLIDNREGDREKTRAIFDNNLDLLSFLQSNLSESTKKDNIIYDLSCDIKRLHVIDLRYKLLTKIFDLDIGSIEFPEEVIIYGVGYIGKNLYMKIKQKCKVMCFIDQLSQDKMYDFIPVYNLKEFSKIPYSATIIVTPMYEYKRIETQIMETMKDRKMEIRPIDDFLSM